MKSSVKGIAATYIRKANGPSQRCNGVMDNTYAVVLESSSFRDGTFSKLIFLYYKYNLKYNLKYNNVFLQENIFLLILP